MKNFNQLVEDMLVDSKILTINGERTISGVWPNQDFSQPFMVDFFEGGTGQIHPEIEVFIQHDNTGDFSHPELEEISEYLFKKNDELYRRLAQSEFQDLLKQHGFEQQETREDSTKHWRISLGIQEFDVAGLLFYYRGEHWLDVVFEGTRITTLISFGVDEFNIDKSHGIVMVGDRSIETSAKTFTQVKELYKLLTGEDLIDINHVNVEYKPATDEQIKGRMSRGNNLILELKIKNIDLEEEVKELKEALERVTKEKESAGIWANMLKGVLYELASYVSPDSQEVVNFGTLETLIRYIKTNIRERDMIISSYQSSQQKNTVKNEWVWYEHQGHTRNGYDCNYCEYTEIGDFAVSTIGECLTSLAGFPLEIPFDIESDTGNEFYYQTKTFLIKKRGGSGRPLIKKELNCRLGENYVDAKQNHHSELTKIDKGFYNDSKNS